MLYFLNFQYQRLAQRIERFDERKKALAFSPLGNVKFSLLQVEKDFKHYKLKTASFWGNFKSLIPTTEAWDARKQCAASLASARCKIMEIDKLLGRDLPADKVMQRSLLKEHAELGQDVLPVVFDSPVVQRKVAKSESGELGKETLPPPELRK